MCVTAAQRVYAELQPGDCVEVVRRLRVGTLNSESRTVATVVSCTQLEAGINSGVRRNWDERQLFPQLLLRKDDGELTTVTLDETTTLKRLGPAKKQVSQE